MSFATGTSDQHDDPPRLFVIKLTAPGDPRKVIGYAMAEQIDYVAKRDDLLGAAKEALEAAEQTFARTKEVHQAVALAPNHPGGVKMFAMIGSSNNRDV